MQPDISIVLSTVSGPDILFRCLESLLNQTYPLERIELIVVDGTDDRYIAKSLNESECSRFFSLKYIPLLHKGPACIRNAGIKNASSEILAFIDDDCVADSDWIKKILETYRLDPELSVVGGSTYVSDKEDTLLADRFLKNKKIEAGINDAGIFFFPACNVSVKKNILAGNLFDEKFFLPGGENLELFWRLSRAGHRFSWNKDIKVIHAADPGIYRFLKHAYYNGRSDLLAARLCPLLTELKTEGCDFWLSAPLNCIAIPFFAYLSGRDLAGREKIKSWRRKISIYLVFLLYRIFYLSGNVHEFLRPEENKMKRQAVLKD